MESDFYIFFAIFAAAMIYLTYRNGIKKNKKTLKEELSEIVSSHPKPRDEDPFLSQIIEEQEHAKKEADSAIRQLETDYEQRFGEDKALKERLTKFAKDHGLDRALTDLWEQSKHYHAWSQREDWDKYNKYSWKGITGASSRDKDENKNTDTLSFIDHGTSYTLTRIQTPSFIGDNDNVEFSLVEDGTVVFAVKAELTYSEYGESYSIYNISAFKKQGNWASMLTRCQQINELESKKISLHVQNYEADTIKDRFKE